MWNLGAPELLLVAFVALLFFGKRVPELMRSLGKGLSEFKRGVSGVEDEVRQLSKPLQ